MTTIKYVVIGLFLLEGLPLQSQRVSIDAAIRTGDKPYVEATGEATVSVKPDRAIIDIGVITQSTTAAAVAAQNAKQTDGVLSDLRTVLTANDQMKTTNYSLRPNYQYPKPGAAVTITGYSASNVVEVTLNDLAQVGKVIDAVIQSGANSIQKLEFGLKNAQAVRSQALREAAARAKSNAEAIAAGLGARVLRTLSAEESEDQDFGMKKAAPPPTPGVAPATPVESGAIEVSATVRLKIEIAE